MKFYNSFLVATLLAGGISHQVISQQMPLQWAYNMPGTAGDSGKDIVTDANGNVIVISDFNGTVDFDPGVGVTNLTSAGSQEGAIAKYDPDGNLIWAVRFGGTGIDAANSVEVDNAGNIYVTGIFQATVDFDPGAGTANLTSLGSYDDFILKLDQNGNLLWVKQLGNVGDDGVGSIDVDASGNVYVSGFFRNTMDFDPNAGIVNTTSGGGADAFVLKLDAAGNYVWHYALTGGNDSDARGMVVDASGNVFLTGYHSGTTDFDFSMSTVNLVSSGVSQDIFVLKLSSGGAYVNAFQIGSTGIDSGRSINVDSQNNILFSGYFSGTCDFDPGVGTTDKTSGGGIDICVSKFDNSLNHIWTSTATGSSDDDAFTVETDDEDNVFVSGYFRTTVDFDPGSGTQNLTVSCACTFVDQFYWKLDSDGNYLSANRAGATAHDHALAYYPSGDYVYITGYFQGTTNYDFEGGTTNLTSAGSGDIYLAKYYNCNPIHTNDVIVSCGPITWIDGNTYSSDNNIATYVLTSVNGCDSTVHLYLNIVDINDLYAVPSVTNICDNGNVMVAIENSQPGVQYWLRDDSDNSIIDGPFEGNSGTITFDAGNISATTTYNVYAEHPSDYGVGFNGPNSDRLEIAEPFRAWGNEITVEAWVKFDGSTNSDVIWMGQSAFNVDNMSTNVWLWHGSSTDMEFFVNDNGTWKSVTSTGFASLSGWHHIATVAGPSGMQIYVDGVLNATGGAGVTSGIVNAPSSIMHIGGDPRFPMNPGYHGTYGITEVRIWNSALDAGEVSANASNCITGNETSLVYYNTLNYLDGSTMVPTVGDEADFSAGMTGANIIAGGQQCSPACNTQMTELVKVVVSSITDESLTPDQTTLCDNGTVTISTGTSQAGVQYFLRDDSDDSVIDGPIAGNGSSLDLSTGSVSSTTTYNVYAENIENSLEFDGVFSEAVIPGVDFSNASFTIEFWGRRNSNTGQDYFVGQGTDNTNDGLHIGFRPTNEFTFAFWFNDLDTPPVNDFDWHHWAMTYDANTNERIIYQDGIVVATDIATADYTGTGDLYLGDTPWGGANLGGNMDELRIWDEVRTANQIQNTMNACLVGDESDLMAYYKFDALSGTSTVTDITSNGFDGTLGSIDVNLAWQMGAMSCSCSAEMTDVVTITVNNSNTGTDVQTHCDSYMWIDGNTYTSSNSTATHLLTNMDGCDSLVTLNLTITNSPTATATNNGDGTISATGTGTYQWIDCGTNTAVSGATSATFIPSANGNYAVVVTSGSCDDTSACVNYNSVSITENNGYTVVLYPNPTDGQTTINFGQIIADGAVQITNLLGEKVYAETISGQSTHELNLDVPAGVYLVNIYSEGALVVTIRLAKN